MNFCLMDELGLCMLCVVMVCVSVLLWFLLCVIGGMGKVNGVFKDEWIVSVRSINRSVSDINCVVKIVNLIWS